MKSNDHSLWLYLKIFFFYCISIWTTMFLIITYTTDDVLLKNAQHLLSFKCINPINSILEALIFYFSKNLILQDYILFLDNISLNKLIDSRFLFIKKNYPLVAQRPNILQTPVFMYFGFNLMLTTLFSFFFFNYLGLYGVFSLNIVSLGSFWISLFFYFNEVLQINTKYKVIVGKWFYLNSNYLVNFDFLIDKISFSFTFLTTTIAFFVYIYTFSYFRYEPLVEKLLLLLCSFVLSMVFLVNSGNLIMMFLGWELIGLTSFFLINFWVTRVGTLKAAFKAYVFNKVSDVFFLFFILIIFLVLYDVDVNITNSKLIRLNSFKICFLFFEFGLIEVLSFLITICAFIKSAQIGTHLWLPDSMEAPVPASALIHSATLVSAGVFLILRFHPLIEASSYCSIIIPFVGSATAFYGGLVATFQSDIKRILAYSTISHCGFLVTLTSFHSNEITIFYLYVHGFFKAAVFLTVGNVIRFNKNYQDFRRMGGLYKYLPFDCFLCFFCLVNLAGLPYSLGFFMKHLYFLAFTKNLYGFSFIFLNSFFGAIFGLFYSYRLFYNVFFDFKKGRKHIYLQTNHKVLDNKYYSNTTLASNFSILGLFIIAYLTIIYLYIIFTDLTNNYSDFDNIWVTTNYNLKVYYYKNKMLNSSFINWIVISLCLIIIFSKFRQYYQNQVHFDQLFDFLLFFIFFYSSYTILSF